MKLVFNLVLFGFVLLAAGCKEVDTSPDKVLVCTDVETGKETFRSERSYFIYAGDNGKWDISHANDRNDDIYMQKPGDHCKVIDVNTND